MWKSTRELIISTITLLVLDGIYIYATQKMFADQITNIQRVVMQFKPLGAVVCYLLLVAGLNYFIISKWNVFIRYYIKNNNNFSLLTVVMIYIRVNYKNIQNI